MSKGQEGLFRDPLEPSSGSIFLYIGQIVAKRQSAGATTVVRELANSFAKKISKSAHQLWVNGTGPAPVEISSLESSL